MNNEFENFRIAFNEAMEKLTKESEDFYESLSVEDQLKVFCAVVRRIHKGEIEERGSYRHVLYDTFGFGPEAYAPAQISGYLAIHNAIYDGESMDKILKNFATNYLNYDKDDIDDQIDKFSRKRYF